MLWYVYKEGFLSKIVRSLNFYIIFYFIALLFSRNEDIMKKDNQYDILVYKFFESQKTINMTF